MMKIDDLEAADPKRQIQREIVCHDRPFFRREQDDPGFGQADPAESSNLLASTLATPSPRKRLLAAEARAAPKLLFRGSADLHREIGHLREHVGRCQDGFIPAK